MTISVKRVYDPPLPTDGLRVLVDRLWPRGLSKLTAKIDQWAKELSPSNDLRRWYAHDATKWPAFKQKYFEELKTKATALESLLLQTKRQKVTLLFGSKEPRLNNAFALKQALEAGARQKLPNTRFSRRAPGGS